MDLSPTDMSLKPQVANTCRRFPHHLSSKTHTEVLRPFPRSTSSPPACGGMSPLRNDECPAVQKDLLSIRVNGSRRSDHCVDTQLLIFGPLNHLFSLPAGFDPAVVCTDCMENCNNYSKDSDYLAQNYRPARGTEYEQYSIPPPYSRCYPAEHHEPGSQAAPHCNGTPNGIRKDIQGSTYPKNHNTLQGNQHDRKGKMISWGSNSTSRVTQRKSN